MHHQPERNADLPKRKKTQLEDPPPPSAADRIIEDSNCNNTVIFSLGKRQAQEHSSYKTILLAPLLPPNHTDKDSISPLSVLGLDPYWSYCPGETDLRVGPH